MKLAILTQPLLSNYGGLLQAYALQRVLKNMGHETWMVRFCDMEYYHTLSWFKTGTKKSLKNAARLILGRKMVLHPTREENDYVRQNTEHFIKKHIEPISPLVSSPRQLKEFCASSGFDGYVVGSDQVWRPLYSPKISNFFLDFCRKADVKRIAYAASFGTDSWEFNEKDTRQCAALAKRFDAVSVREDSGITLCEKYLGVTARQVLDPTLLLDKEDYIRIVEEDNIQPCKGDLFCYILDEREGKRELVDWIADKYGMKPFRTMPELYFTRQNLEINPQGCVFPSVSAWLRSFMDARFVVTDSFHGCVFSILFNKPFVAIGNEDRGQSRFRSLLKLFGIEKRLCSTREEIEAAIETPIEWEIVNKTREQWRKDSIELLTQTLNNKQKDGR